MTETQTPTNVLTDESDVEEILDMIEEKINQGDRIYLVRHIAYDTETDRPEVDSVMVDILDDDKLDFFVSKLGEYLDSGDYGNCYRVDKVSRNDISNTHLFSFNPQLPDYLADEEE